MNYTWDMVAVVKERRPGRWKAVSINEDLKSGQRIDAVRTGWDAVKVPA